MKTFLRIIGGIILIIGGFVMARVGCVVLVYGLHGGSVSSIVGAIVGIALIAGGVYLSAKGWH